MSEHTARIIHVDDNPAELVTLRRLVAEAAPHIEVLSLESGEELLETLQQPGAAARTDLILLDLGMPRMSGVEAIGRLKGDPELSRIPVVALSSSNDPDDVRATYGQGANAHLVKTADLERYRSRLGAALLLWCDTDSRPATPFERRDRGGISTAADPERVELRALVVDDVAADNTLLQRHLEKLPQWHVVCDVAGDLAEAARCLGRQSYDLLFLDHRLPGASGLELIDRERHLLGNAGTILLTGFGDESVASSAIAAGVDAYMAKRDLSPETLEASMGRALERARQRYGRYRDPLTELNNRGAFEERMVEEINRCRRYGGRFALMLIDLDAFKQVNDSLGHLAGDDLLKQCAAAFRQVLRHEDFMARYGGDEFCIIAHESSMEEAEFLAGRLRRRIRETVFECGKEGHPVRIDCSIGITRVDGDTDEDADAILRRVDEAMYASKRAGGTGVRVLDS